MTYFITYLIEVARTVQAVMIDDRTNQFPENANGNQIKPIIDTFLGTIGENSLPYKIETELGNLIGFFVLLVDKDNLTVTIQKKVLRPQFELQFTAINSYIDNFIASNEWIEDVLL